MQSSFTVLVIILGLDLSKTSRLKRQCQDSFGCQSTTQLPFIPARSNCVLPEYPDNGKWSIFDGPRKFPGEIVPAKTIVQYQCDSQYKLMPESEFSICHRFWSIQPICLKTCPSLPTTPTLHISCEIDNQLTSCIDPYEGSTARVACISSLEIKYLKCINGSWDASLPFCIPGSTCMFKSPDINDEDISPIVPGEFPFMARINYKDRDPCVGALVSECFVIVPAYCTSRSPTSIQLGSSSHNINESITQHVGTFEQVRRAPLSIIALMKLKKPVTVNSYVQPISITESEAIDSRVFYIGMLKEVQADNLKRMIATNITSNECKENNPEDIYSHNVCLALRKSSAILREGVFVAENKEVPCKYRLVSVVTDIYDNGTAVGIKLYSHLNWIKKALKETC